MMHILGVDFTSSPRPAKPIVAAWAERDGHTVHLHTLERLTDWASFERLLARPGPWVGAFDLPFGLPREMVRDLGWPNTWPALVRHCASLGRQGLREVIDAYRATRPVGQKFAHRATDLPAGSSSPMKLVNPPVALMFLEGAPRLLDAQVCIPGLHPAGSPDRVALEGYPGLTARQLTRDSYKSDTRSQHTESRRKARGTILEYLQNGDNPLGLTLHAPPKLTHQLLEDGSGDLLDATLCAIQAAWAEQRRWGLPAHIDPIEGWILTAAIA